MDRQRGANTVWVWKLYPLPMLDYGMRVEWRLVNVGMSINCILIRESIGAEVVSGTTSRGVSCSLVLTQLQAQYDNLLTKQLSVGGIKAATARLRVNTARK